MTHNIHYVVLISPENANGHKTAIIYTVLYQLFPQMSTISKNIHKIFTIFIIKAVRLVDQCKKSNFCIGLFGFAYLIFTLLFLCFRTRLSLLLFLTQHNGYYVEKGCGVLYECVQKDSHCLFYIFGSYLLLSISLLTCRRRNSRVRSTCFSAKSVLDSVG